METLVGKDIYSQLANLLDYPREDIRIRIDEVIEALKGYTQYPPEVINELQEFKKRIEDLSLDDIQGTYSYTFEMSADHTLDMGHYLFEGFKRSENLLNIKTMYRKYDFPFETLDRGELPDHLPLVLRFMAFVKDEEIRRDFRRDFVIKAIEKLNKNFANNQENPYSHLINSVYKIIDRDVKEVK